MRRGRDARGRAGRQAAWFRVTAAASSAALLGTLGLAGTSMAATGAAASAATTRETAATALVVSPGQRRQARGHARVRQRALLPGQPERPVRPGADAEPAELLQDNGTFLSNNHTPLIAHTADNILTTLTGLYGDRHGMPISNSYQAYNADGPNGSFNTTDPAGSFAYWTDPVFDTKTPPSAGHDTNPNMVYSPVPPATAAHPVAPNTVTPAPWAPYTRAGCDVGEVATANQELENTGVDIPKVFGAGSPEDQQLNADTDSFKDAETADYVGIGVHCAQGNAFCADAKAVKFGQTSASPTAVADLLPDEPGGYNGFQALFGHRYVAPQLGAGTPNLIQPRRPGHQRGREPGRRERQPDQRRVPHQPPGLPRVRPDQRVAEPGLHGRHAGVRRPGGERLHRRHPRQRGHPRPVVRVQAVRAVLRSASGTACYIAQAQYYNQAFGTFFQRLAADGITPANTLFELSSDEGDHVAGANVGRAIQPTPANCDGVTTPCTYPAGTFGELAGNVTGLLATQKNNTTPFSLESDSAPEFYVTGKPGPNVPQVRTLERDVAGLTAANPYTGTTQKIANYLADPAEMAILHMVNADPARTPTFALFAKPDYFLSPGAANCSKPCVVGQTPAFA